MIPILLVAALASSSGDAADAAIPVLTFPILSSPHIGSQCSFEENHIVALLELARDGTILDLTLVKESSISALNDEAIENISALSPITEIQDLSEEEAARHHKVQMIYSVPCRTESE